MSLITKFRKDVADALTVDWVVLTAAIFALAGAAYGSIQAGSATLSSNADSFMYTKATETE